MDKRVLPQLRKTRTKDMFYTMYAEASGSILPDHPRALVAKAAAALRYSIVSFESDCRESVLDDEKDDEKDA